MVQELQKELSQCEQDIKVEVFSTNEATLLATETVPVTSGKEATEEVDNNTEDGDAIVEAEPEEALEETVDISDADIEEEIDESEVTMAENQQVSWGPAKGQAAGICVDPDCNELIIWEQLKQEMETSILPKLTDLPPDSQIMLKDYKDKKDWIVIIADENGKEIANVWFGANPLNKWKYDGLIRIGTPKAPVKLFGTFERYSDGYYEFNNE